MEKRRVYQVAKARKLSSDALISMLKSMNFEVKSHMSVVTEEMLAAVEQKLEAEKKSSIAELKRQTEKEKSRKEAETAPVQTPPAATSETAEQRPKARRKSTPEPAPAKAQRSDNLVLPPKDGEERQRRSRKRGKAKAPETLEDVRENLGEKREVTAKADPAPTTSRRRGVKRRKSTDARAVQESVRKTLSQINEGRTRRRYTRDVREEDGEDAQVEATKQLQLSEFITLAEFAEAMGVKPNDVIGVCLQLGLMATINQRLDMDTMATVGLEFGYTVERLDAEEAEEIEELEVVDDSEGGEPVERPPVVTVMGHVDHGKTSLLDLLRKTNVVAGESGGITQHIGAYALKTKNGRSLTFLDTPGHAAFTAMRARGARVTDIVILIVAAEDSVMPQTIEAINHAKDAQVPIVVAINKVDLPTADPERIKRELAERGVLVEEWSGQVPCAEISAKTGQGIDDLLELVLLSADMLELKADPVRRARGTIVEALLDKGRGPVATVLVQEGTLRVGDPFVTGVLSGRVRALLDEHGQKLDEATPSMPAQVVGLPGVPQAGDQFVITASDREAKEIGQRRQQVKREQEHRRIRTVTLSDIHDQITQGRMQELRVLIKGDVDGSVEAIAQELGSITHDEVRVQVIHSGVGPITEADVLLASASGAVIIGFHVSISPHVREIAKREGVEIRNYKVIYEVIEEIRAALSGMLAPTVAENVVGEAEVRQIFRSSRIGTIAGCMMRDGRITRSHTVRVLRNGDQVFKGGVASLRRFKDDVREVSEGFECGIGLEGYNDLEEGDLIQALEVVETARTL